MAGPARRRRRRHHPLPPRPAVLRGVIAAQGQWRGGKRGKREGVGGAGPAPPPPPSSA